MMQTIIFVLSFVSLYIAVLTLSFLYLSESPKAERKESGSVTIAVPCHNEEKRIESCLFSLLALEYPEEKIIILVVDDGSTDKTAAIASSFIKKHPRSDIRLIRQSQMGKASALNTALASTKTEFFGVLDADSLVDKAALKELLPHFSDTTAAVITALKVHKPRNIYEKVQHIEYILAILIRRIMSALNTLHITPGVLSVYRTHILKDLGGFDASNITEDFEIALRIKYNGYDIKLAPESITYTAVPRTFKSLWRQRIRWFRGFITNYLSYKDMFFNRKYGLTGYYQLPVGVISIPLFLFMLSLGVVTLASDIFEDTLRTLTIQGYFFEKFLEIPTLDSLLYGQNFKILIPVFIISSIGVLFFIVAHRQIKEKIINPFAILMYFSVYPFLTGIHWIMAISHELVRSKRKW